jgi:hypothetical protein
MSQSIRSRRVRNWRDSADRLAHPREEGDEKGWLFVEEGEKGERAYGLTKQGERAPHVKSDGVKTWATSLNNESNPACSSRRTTRRRAPSNQAPTRYQVATFPEVFKGHLGTRLLPTRCQAASCRPGCRAPPWPIARSNMRFLRRILRVLRFSSLTMLARVLYKIRGRTRLRSAEGFY